MRDTNPTNSGNPEHPHHRKHAFDLGEYGAGYLTNSLSLGCDCKGSIHYLDAEFPTRVGGIRKIKNAICIHEEDAGILFKHTDFRDDSVIVTRGRKLIVQQIFTAANYEYVVAWIFHQDGTIQPEIKLTGILNTYIMDPDEDTHGWGTQVYTGVNAHNHQHLFCLRIDANVDGPDNSVYVTDAVPGDAPVGSKENFYGNAFYSKRTKLATTGEGKTDYIAQTSRTWEICNPNKLNPYSKKPVSYKLVSREVPTLLPKEGSLVWKRAAFARHSVHVTKCKPLNPISPPFSLMTTHMTDKPPYYHRPRRPTLACWPTRPSNLRRALERSSRVDRRRYRVHRQHQRRCLAHLWRHPLPHARGFPCYAGRAHDAAAAPTQLLCPKPGAGCAPQLCKHAEPAAG